jgi:hypothetical protein
MDYVQALKNSTPCTDCRKLYPYYVMDFDHLEGSDKLNNVNYLSYTGRIKALKIEIAKCEIVCSNCHRARTYRRSLRSKVE